MYYFKKKKKSKQKIGADSKLNPVHCSVKHIPLISEQMAREGLGQGQEAASLPVGVWGATWGPVAGTCLQLVFPCGGRPRVWD